MKMCYADPPYLGYSKKFCGDHPGHADFDNPERHRQLIEQLSAEYDAWALSLLSTNLRLMLPWCPSDVRVGAWCKSFASFKPNVRHAYAWEPVIFRFARKRTGDQQTWRDFIVEPITILRGFVGCKPEKFCVWIFEGLNIQPGDTFVDLFPGSGAITAAFQRWQSIQRPEQFQLIREVATEGAP